MQPEQGPHLTRKGGREHDGLAIRPDVGDDEIDLRLKSHVKHAICLIHDQVGDAMQVGDLSAGCHKHIDHAPRRTHHDLCTTLEL